MIEEENLNAPGLHSTQGGAHTGDGADQQEQDKLKNLRQVIKCKAPPSGKTTFKHNLTGV